MRRGKLRWNYPFFPDFRSGLFILFLLLPLSLPNQSVVLLVFVMDMPSDQEDLTDEENVQPIIAHILTELLPPPQHNTSNVSATSAEDLLQPMEPLNRSYSGGYSGDHFRSFSVPAYSGADDLLNRSLPSGSSQPVDSVYQAFPDMPYHGGMVSGSFDHAIALEGAVEVELPTLPVVAAAAEPADFLPENLVVSN